jgi:hypothetical protein
MSNRPFLPLYVVLTNVSLSAAQDSEGDIYNHTAIDAYLQATETRYDPRADCTCSFAFKCNLACIAEVGNV